MKQIGMADRGKLEAQIEKILAELDPQTEIGTTLLRRYTRWDELREVPMENLPQLLHDLQMEKRVFESMGENMYFSAITVQQKQWLDIQAVQMLPERLAAMGYGPEDGITFAERKRAWNACIRAVERIAPPPPRAEEETKPAPKRKSAAKKKKRRTPKRKPFVPPTVEEVAEYCRQRGNSIDPKYFVEIYEVANWTDSTGKPVLNWKQRILSWENRAKNGSGPPVLPGVIGRGANIVPIGPIPKPDDHILGRDEGEYVPFMQGTGD